MSSTLTLLNRAVTNARAAAVADGHQRFVLAVSRGYTYTECASAVPFGQSHFRVGPDGSVYRREYEFVAEVWTETDATARFAA